MVSRTAAAAPALMPTAQDGEGIKVGQRSRFHPGFGIGVGMDSNVFYEDKGEDPAIAAFLVATGWARIGNRQVQDGLLDSPADRTDRKVDYNIGLILGFRQFLDRRSEILKQSRFSLGADIHFIALPGRKFSFEFDDSFFRLAEPRDIQARETLNFNRITNDGRLRLVLRPGGGRVALTAGYLNQLLYFENQDEQVNRSNRIGNGALAEVKWRFFPTSAVYARYSMLYTYYFSCCTEPGTGRNEDNYAHRIEAGYRGQLGKRVVLGAMFGWGLAYYRLDPNGPNFSGPIASLSLDVFPTVRTRLHLSGERTFRDALLGNFFVDYRVRLLASHQFRWRMVASLGGGFVHREYRGLPTPGVEDVNIAAYEGAVRGGTARRDLLFNVLARLEQPLGRFFALRLDYTATIDQSPLVVVFADGTRNEAGFVRHLLMLFGAVRY
ncbi:MAG: hypothetical protein D6705_10830 [Deltaproteobacteria bacterium]|nr:MAG: hypothetical protein D6705_10830 [Deltaproteobacteria bacterium]